MQTLHVSYMNGEQFQTTSIATWNDLLLQIIKMSAPLKNDKECLLNCIKASQNHKKLKQKIR